MLGLARKQNIAGALATASGSNSRFDSGSRCASIDGITASQPYDPLRRVRAKAQVPFPVCHKGQYVGEYMADLVVEEKVIVELKCVDRFSNDTWRNASITSRPQV